MSWGGGGGGGGGEGPQPMHFSIIHATTIQLQYYTT